MNKSMQEYRWRSRAVIIIKQRGKKCISGNQRNSINKETEEDVEVSRETIEEVS